MKNIHNWSVFYVNDSPVKNTCMQVSMIQYKLLLTKYCLAQYLSFKLDLRWWFTVW